MGGVQPEKRSSFTDQQDWRKVENLFGTGRFLGACFVGGSLYTSKTYRKNINHLTQSYLQLHYNHMSYSFWWCFWNRCHHMMSHFQTARCQKSIFRADIRFVGRLKQPQNVWPFLALTTFHRFVGPSCNQNPTHWMACAGRQNDLMDVCGQAAAIIKHIVVRLRGEMLRTRRSHETEVVKQGHKPKKGSCYR